MTRNERLERLTRDALLLIVWHMDSPECDEEWRDEAQGWIGEFDELFPRHDVLQPRTLLNARGAR